MARAQVLAPSTETMIATGANSFDSLCPPTPSTNKSSGQQEQATTPLGKTSPSISRPSPCKLRRKVSVDHELENSVSVQRLVEYFVVISCQPRWGTSNTNIPPPPNTPPSPKKTVKRPNSILTTNRSCSLPVAVTPTYDKNETQSLGSKLRHSASSIFRRNPSATAPSGTEHAIRATISQDDLINGCEEEESVPPPKPRGTWKKDDPNGDTTEGNIHLPDTDVSEERTFQPKITARYPPSDHPDNPLNPMITQFCYPVGDVILPTDVYEMPSVHHFVLTNEKGRKLYGTCLTIYEEYNPTDNDPWSPKDRVHGNICGQGVEVTMGTEDVQLYLPRCLCILSIWPYVSAFREYLAQLYRLATTTNCMNAPIERFIVNICSEIPAPPPGAFEVQINILDSVIRFWSPPAKLPIAYVALPYQILFDCLDIKNILHLWYCLTMERKILLVSSQTSILTVCSEILCSLLYPMKWSHLYVPLLPRFLSPMLDAPVPYLCGVTRDNWLHVQQFVSVETIVVDLDRNNVMFGEQTPVMPPVPGKKWIKLQESLDDIAGHLFWRARGLETEFRAFVENKTSSEVFQRVALEQGETLWNEKLTTFDQAFNLQFTPDSENLKTEESIQKEDSQWDRLQEAFLRFFVAVLKDYRRFLHTPDDNSIVEDPNEFSQWSKRRSFDRDGFLSSQKPEYLPYLSELCMTQQFDDFITKRLYSPEMPDIIFFDQSIDAKLNRSRLKLKKLDTPFLESAKAHKVLKTFAAVEPNSADMAQLAPFVYKCWPVSFDPALFCEPRPIPKIITAEFDRQAALVSRLRSQAPSSDGPPKLLNFYGSDYDSSPEGMAFTVFFFTYSSVIGREWRAFQLKRKELEMPSIQSPRAENSEQRENRMRPVHEEGVEITPVGKDGAVVSGSVLSDISLGLCDGCPDATVDDAVVFVTHPCRGYINEINNQAQVAYDAINRLALSPGGDLEHTRDSSLLDNDDAFAEYEEARDVAVAQLDLAFDTLETLEVRGFLADPDVFKSLMEACGRCGDTKRALVLIEMMKRDGLVADQEVLSCFMAAFAHDDNDHPVPVKNQDLVEGSRQVDAYSHLLEKNLNELAGDVPDGDTLKTRDSEDTDGLSDLMSESGSEMSAGSSLKQPVSFLDWFNPRNQDRKHKRKRRHRKRKSQGVPVDFETDRLIKQIILGESLLDFLYPNLFIDTSGDTCVQCSKQMSEHDVISGWQPCEFQDFTTSCPRCKHRFVPRFSVSCSSPTFVGSQGLGTPLFCEFLSPWVLRKELNHLIASEGGVDSILDPEWRSGTDIRATLWWNLISMFQRYRLPFSFLLQGSFRNRLISPVPQDSL